MIYTQLMIPIKIFKTNFLANAWAEWTIQLKIRIQHEIWRRIVCVDILFILISPTFHMKIKIAWALNAYFIENGYKTTIDSVLTHTIWRQILRWIRIFSKYFIPVTNLGDNSIWINLVAEETNQYWKCSKNRTSNIIYDS